MSVEKPAATVSDFGNPPCSYAVLSHASVIFDQYGTKVVMTRFAMTTCMRFLKALSKKSTEPLIKKCSKIRASSFFGKN